MALARRAAARPVYGNAKPRIAPPIPARTEVALLRQAAADMGIELIPWQDLAGRYLYAVGPGDRWLYREVPVIVSRQNGKTTVLKPHIVARLRMGRRIMHTAQNRELPREVFGDVADFMMTRHRDELKSKPRFANGQEEIRMRNGGVYRIVAPTRGGARGPSNDDLIIDELREMVSHDFIAAAKPTLTASANPQTVYLSNAGSEDSEVLNALKLRAGEDSNLAYLEWSAAPERATDDIAGWLEGNPSIGHMPQTLPNLEAEHRAHSLGGTLHIFNTEHLCRWVTSDLPAFVEPTLWAGARRPNVGIARRPSLAVSMDPSGKRASIAIAWRGADPRVVSVRILGDVTGSPIDADALGTDIQKQARRMGLVASGYDPETDAHLARYLTGAKPVVGAQWTAACSRFVNLVEGGQLQWEGPDDLLEDIRWTTRRADPQDGTYRAVKAKEDRPVTTIFAAIRAAWLASEQAQATGWVM